MLNWHNSVVVPPLALSKADYLQLLFGAGLYFLLTGCASVQTPAEESVRGVTELSDHVSSLGIEYSRAFMPDAEKISLHVVWPNDWAHNNRIAVASSLGVDLMSTGGAGGRTARQIKQSVTALGSSASLIATPDHIYGTFTSSTETFSETVSIVRDVIIDPVLSEPRFDALKEALRKRIESRQLKPSSKLWNVARRALLGDSSLADYWNNIPYERVVAPITLTNVKDWHRETFVRSGARVAIAGQIDESAAGLVVDQLLGDLPRGTLRLQLTRAEVKTGYTVLLKDVNASSTMIAIVGLLPPSSEGEEISDIVAVAALGNGSDSRLVAAQKANLPDASPVSASIANFSRDVRVFGINTQATDEEAAVVYDLIEKTYRAFKLASLDSQEVLRAAVPFANSIKKNTNQVDLIAYGLGQLLLDELPKDKLLTVMQDALALRATIINQRISERYPEWESLVKVIMSSDAEVIAADCVIESLEELSRCDL